MAGLTNQIAAGLVTEITGLTGLGGSSKTPVDSVPITPFFYVGPPKLVQVGGSWEQRTYSFPLHLLIARVTEDRDQVAVNDWIDLILNAYRTGITLGITGVVSAEIKTVDSDKFYSLGTVDYQSADMDVVVTVMGPATYTP